MLGNPIRRLLGAALAVALLAAAGKPAPAPTPDKLPALSASLATALTGRTVRLPDGSEAPVIAPTAAAPGLLTQEQLLECLKTTGEAEAWPSAWLVVQDASRPFDLVIHLRLAQDGSVESPDVVLTASRRDWDADSIQAAVREATGRRPPRERSWNVVVQTIKTRVSTTYVYQTPKTGKEAQGLLALLPEGSLIREAKSLDLRDGERRTLAVVLVRPSLVPVDCDSCAGKLFGHADTAEKVLLVLASGAGLEATLDLTAALKGAAGKPLVPHFECRPGDSNPAEQEKPFAERFKGREPARLLELKDLTGAGAPLQFALPAEMIDCDRHTSVVVGVDRSTRKLRIFFERLEKT